MFEEVIFCSATLQTIPGHGKYNPHPTHQKKKKDVRKMMPVALRTGFGTSLDVTLLRLNLYDKQI